jgi:ABC-type dipeptide/oligopeptide/nickel transport system permease subunit
LMLGIVGLGVLFLGSLFGSLGLLSALDFLGLGAQPPLPSLGGLVQAGMMTFGRGGSEAVPAGLALWACAFALYTATDALIGFFYTKDAMARLNE